MEKDIVKTDEKKPLNIPKIRHGLIPQTLDEALKMATIMSKSNIVPRELVGRPEAIFVALSFGMEIGLPPMQAVQSIMIVNGRPTIWGDAALALAQGSNLIDKVEEDAPDVAAKNGTGRCKVTLKNGMIVERRFSIEDAKRAKLMDKGGPWLTYPGRMLQMRARAWALRDSVPQVLKGIQMREEVADYQSSGYPEVEMPKPVDAVEVSEELPFDAQEPGNAPIDGELKITEDRRKELFRKWSAAKIPLKEVKAYVGETFGIADTKELTNDQASELESWIAGHK